MLGATGLKHRLGASRICPGPVLASLTQAGPKAWIYFGSLVGGMLLFELTAPRRDPASSGQTSPSKQAFGGIEAMKAVKWQY